MKYHDEVTGQHTKAGHVLWKRAKLLLEPLMKSARTGMEAKERELIIQSALSTVRVLKAMRVAGRSRKRK
jgi:hypothetical protein